ncbi:hypothetical protein GF378_01210 [Candidatus Pacearchaeota archaeon]|nr:hypothetical protein [Candidatus Pacearchaeota archaeon]
MKKKTQKILIQLVIIAILIALSYMVLETALAFLVTIILLAFIIWRNKIYKTLQK